MVSLCLFATKTFFLNQLPPLKRPPNGPLTLHPFPVPNVCSILFPAILFKLLASDILPILFFYLFSVFFVRTIPLHLPCVAFLVMTPLTNRIKSIFSPCVFIEIARRQPFFTRFTCFHVPMIPCAPRQVNLNGGTKPITYEKCLSYVCLYRAC